MNDEAGDVFNPLLQAGSQADFTNVTASDCDLDYFTAHVVVVDYPRVKVTDCRFEGAVVGGMDGFGLRVSTPPPQNLTVPYGSPREYEAFLNPEDRTHVSLATRDGFRDIGTYVVVTNSTFSRLRSKDAQGRSLNGGAAYLAGFEYGELTDVHVSGTRVAGNGGGVMFDGVHYVWVSGSEFRDVAIRNATAEVVYGGGLFLKATTEVLVTDTVFRNIDATNGFGAAMYFAPPTRAGEVVTRILILDTVVQECTATRATVYLLQATEVYVGNSTFTRNLGY